MTAHVTNEQCQLARRLQALGKSLRDIAKKLGVCSAGVHVMLRGQRREALRRLDARSRSTTLPPRDI